MTNITSKNLSFSYDGKTKLLTQLNLSIPTKKFSLLIGPTGCGKSTFLKLLAGLYPQYAGNASGQIQLNGMSHAMMFQNADEQFTMRTPREEIIFALENLQITKDQYPKRLSKAAEFAQVSDILDQTITTLSGGQQQKVALAVLIAMDVELFLLDEPFASCDQDTRKFLIKKLANLRDQGKTIIISDHVLANYQEVCDYLFQFSKDTIVELSPEAKDRLLKPHSLPNTAKFSLPKKDSKSIFTFHKTIIRQNNLLLKQKNLNIYRHKTTLITGPNGVGKTSLFKALTKMIPYEGELFYQDKEIRKLSTRKYLLKVAQIFQKATDQFLNITVQDELNLSLKKRKPKNFSSQNLEAILKYLSLDTHLNQIVYSLSGGQQKKLQILLMLLSRHQVLLLDEPLSGLDYETSKKVIHLLANHQKKYHQTILIISHELPLDLINWCDYHLQFEQQKLTYTERVTE